MYCYYYRVCCASGSNAIYRFYRKVNSLLQRTQNCLKYVSRSNLDVDFAQQYQIAIYRPAVFPAHQFFAEINLTHRSLEMCSVYAERIVENETKKKKHRLWGCKFENANASGKMVERVTAHTTQRKLNPCTKPISFRRRATRLQLITNGAQRITPIRHTLILVAYRNEQHEHTDSPLALDMDKLLVVRVFGCARKPNENATLSFECPISNVTATVRVVSYLLQCRTLNQ